MAGAAGLRPKDEWGWWVGAGCGAWVVRAGLVRVQVQLTL